MIQMPDFSRTSLAASAVVAAFSGFDQAVASPEYYAPGIPDHFIELRADDLPISFLQAGDPSNPTLVVLTAPGDDAGMLATLSPSLIHEFHVLAADYRHTRHHDLDATSEPDNVSRATALALQTMLRRNGISRYALFLSTQTTDLAYRLFELDPESVTGLIVSARLDYPHSLARFWQPVKAQWQQDSLLEDASMRASLNVQDGRWQFTVGMRSPDATTDDDYWYAQFLLDQTPEDGLDLAYFLTGERESAVYSNWHEALATTTPPALVVWDEPSATNATDPNYEQPITSAYSTSMRNSANGSVQNPLFRRKLNAFLDTVTSR
ncbi:hypothetical protein [Roseibium sp.]|uniref:hypothetical protein n=1 Tax=Roseibium sp. TaxID=1936156 RepID=UPI003A96B9D0